MLKTKQNDFWEKIFATMKQKAVKIMQDLPFPQTILPQNEMYPKIAIDYYFNLIIHKWIECEIFLAI